MAVSEAEAVEKAFREWNREDPASFWSKISKKFLHPNVPFVVHQDVFCRVYSRWDKALGPAPAWIPSEEGIKASNLHEMMSRKGIDCLDEFYRWSIERPDAFVEEMLKRLKIGFHRKPTDILISNPEYPQWLYQAKLNIVESCFNSDDEATAILSQNDNGELVRLSYSEFHERVARVVYSLRQRGAKPGDRVGMAMPMTSEAIVIYLGIIATGCSALPVAESFSTQEIHLRFEIGNPICIFTQDVIKRSGKKLPLYEKVAAATSAPCIIFETDNNSSFSYREQDLSWRDFLKNKADYDFDVAEPEKEICLLFSSGTSGHPKAIPWKQMTPLKAANDAHLHQDLHSGDVVCWPTSLGWMMGPWLVFASLINRATIAITQEVPTHRGFGKFIQDSQVTMLGIVPSIVKAWREHDCMRGLDWSAIRAFSSTGECSNADDMHFLMSLAGYKPIIEYCGGTEVGGAYITGTVIQPCAPGNFSTPAMGFNLCILDKAEQPGPMGEMFFIPPALGLSTEIINGNHHEVYFEETPKGPNGELLRRHGDQMEALPGGYFRAHGRVDDAMNLGGIKVSVVQIEELLRQCPFMHDIAAIAVAPHGGGPSRLVIYFVPSEKVPCDDPRLEMQYVIREQLNPLFKIHDVVAIDALPRTASNKVMRRQLRALYETTHES